MNEGDTDKRQVGLRLQLELVKKAVKEFGRPRDKGEISHAIIRALEEATREVHLTPQEFAECTAEAEENMRKRMAKRKGMKRKPK